jgi:hypothetical protein
MRKHRRRINPLGATFSPLSREVTPQRVPPLVAISDFLNFIPSVAFHKIQFSPQNIPKIE